MCLRAGLRFHTLYGLSRRSSPSNRNKSERGAGWSTGRKPGGPPAHGMRKGTEGVSVPGDDNVERGGERHAGSQTPANGPPLVGLPWLGQVGEARRRTAGPAPHERDVRSGTPGSQPPHRVLPVVAAQSGRHRLPTSSRRNVGARTHTAHDRLGPRWTPSKASLAPGRDTLLGPLRHPDRQRLDTTSTWVRTRLNRHRTVLAHGLTWRLSGVIHPALGCVRSVRERRAFPDRVR